MPPSSVRRRAALRRRDVEGTPTVIPEVRFVVTSTRSTRCINGEPAGCGPDPRCPARAPAAWRITVANGAIGARPPTAPPVSPSPTHGSSPSGSRLNRPDRCGGRFRRADARGGGDEDGAVLTRRPRGWTVRGDPVRCRPSGGWRHGAYRGQRTMKVAESAARSAVPRSTTACSGRLRRRAPSARSAPHGRNPLRRGAS